MDSASPTESKKKPKPPPDAFNFVDELVRRSIKIFDIGYSTAVYFISALGCILVLQWIMGDLPLERVRAMPTHRIVGRIISRMWLAAVLAYIVRNIFHLIPFPLNGVRGYNHLKTKEVINSAIFFAGMVTFDTNLQKEVGVLRERIGGVGTTTR